MMVSMATAVFLQEYQHMANLVESYSKKKEIKVKAINNLLDSPKQRNGPVKRAFAKTFLDPGICFKLQSNKM